MIKRFDLHQSFQSPMENHPRTRTFPLFISLSFLLLSIVSAFSPTDHYLINCGSTKPTTVDADNRRFTGDSSEVGAQFCISTRTISLSDSNPSPGSSPIYHTARVFTTPSKYAFKIKDRGTHLVRLHFHPFDSSNFNLYDSQFHVSANGHLLLTNFTVVKTEAPKIKHYIVWVDTGDLVVTFVPSEKSKVAFVNVIEVISAPKDLVADVAMLVSSEKKPERINGLMKNAFETVYRINAGGPKVTPFNDSLWRTWVPDDEFLKLSDGSERVHFGGRIKYQIGGASREVGPDNVYNSARVIRSSNGYVPQKNISWEFSVIGGYNYLVRLHFCDIASTSLNFLYFNVYVNGMLVFENLDLSSLTMALASPFYTDFVVNMESSAVLTVSVGPSNISMPHSIDAILNGVEIMKMNNSMGSLDGDVCLDTVLKSWPRRSSIGAVVSLIAAACLFGTAFVVMHRRWAGVKNSVAWSPIPVDSSNVNLKFGNLPSLGKA